MGMEDRLARNGGRIQPDHRRDALAPGSLEVESDRPSHVQPDQRQLGRRTADQLRNHAELHSHDALGKRFSLSGLLGSQGLRRPKSDERTATIRSLETAASVSPMELLDLSP